MRVEAGDQETGGGQSRARRCGWRPRSRAGPARSSRWSSSGRRSATTARPSRRWGRHTFPAWHRLGWSPRHGRSDSIDAWDRMSHWLRASGSVWLPPSRGSRGRPGARPAGAQHSSRAVRAQRATLRGRGARQPPRAADAAGPWSWLLHHVSTSLVTFRANRGEQIAPTLSHPWPDPTIGRPRSSRTGHRGACRRSHRLADGSPRRPTSAKSS